MQQIYKRTPMPKCDFNKVACCIFSEHPFLGTPLGGYFCMTVTEINFLYWQSVHKWHLLTLFRMGIFGAAHGWGGQKGHPLPKICHTYPTVMKLGAVIPCLKKIQKIYESRDMSPESSNLNISRNTDIDCILVHNF